MTSHELSMLHLGFLLIQEDQERQSGQHRGRGARKYASPKRSTTDAMAEYEQKIKASRA